MITVSAVIVATTTSVQFLKSDRSAGDGFIILYELPKVKITCIKSKEQGGHEKQAVKHKKLSDLW